MCEDYIGSVQCTRNMWRLSHNIGGRKPFTLRSTLQQGLREKATCSKVCASVVVDLY